MRCVKEIVETAVPPIQERGIGAAWRASLARSAASFGIRISPGFNDYDAPEIRLVRPPSADC